MIKKILIANRGEIAIRVMRACQEMGIGTVAVYSDADANAMHTEFADEAVWIGESSASHSYLDHAKILNVARQTGAEAIHPGYGFLSERAEFVEACDAAGVKFIGPSAAAMRKLGSKIDAKALAVKEGVPITPGYFEPGATAKDLEAAAAKIGYPVMLKASAGGGGRGMRIVREPSALAHEFELASEEAEKAFGDRAMMVEKLVEQPRHIEVQVLADTHGNVACLFERECSLQRRHQKVLEEACSPVVGESQWKRLREYCIKLVKASGYSGAGTVEFMYDEPSDSFYFLEVNARLQVEHPVTEAITGLDLVKWQIRIASGEKLELPAPLMEGDRRSICGHAIEARIVAEDPAVGFMPSIGKLVAWAEPKRPGVRIDSGFGAGREISRFYDSLIAKAIAHAPTRVEAIDRLAAALEDFHILGVKTNIAYLLAILRHPDFVAGKMDTGFLGREFGEWKDSDEVPSELLAIAEAAAAPSGGSAVAAVEPSPWDASDLFRNAR
ncbi:MAG: ATP-grasp domain-containing protein [Armatimonadetes bacterium]|nr:ATP-grasp domain-containing protein [Armatimonadota bacterium]